MSTLFQLHLVPWCVLLPWLVEHRYEHWGPASSVILTPCNIDHVADKHLPQVDSRTGGAEQGVQNTSLLKGGALNFVTWLVIWQSQA